MVPVCRSCPENTYQDRPGGRACLPCPANHVTTSTGAKSSNECIGKLNSFKYSKLMKANCFHNH